MTLDPEAASNALAHLGEALDLEPEAVAWGVYRVMCENMAQAARVHIIEQGHDPRNYQLMAFACAGPAHAARVARILGSPEVIVPQHSGVAAALGFLVAPASFEFTRSYPDEVQRLDWGVVDRLYQDLERQAHAVLADAGVSEADMIFERLADMRFSGQFHEIAVPVPPGTLSETVATTITTSFEQEYARLYHAVMPGYTPMVLNWRLQARGPEPERAFTLQHDGPQPGPTAAGGENQAKGTRRAYFPERGWVEVTVFDRTTLASGSTLEGPVIVEEAESTTVVNPGDRLSVDALGNLRIEVEQS